MCLQFGFVIFWQKDFGTKVAHKMVVKLTPRGCLLISESILNCSSMMTFSKSEPDEMSNAHISLICEKNTFLYQVKSFQFCEC
jgi:hypothetical protein